MNSAYNNHKEDSPPTEERRPLTILGVLTASVGAIITLSFSLLIGWGEIKARLDSLRDTDNVLSRRLDLIDNRLWQIQQENRTMHNDIDQNTHERLFDGNASDPRGSYARPQTKYLQHEGHKSVEPIDPREP